MAGRKFMSGSRSPALVAAVFLLALLLLPAAGQCDWKDVDAILMETFGEEVARECADYFNTLDIDESQVDSVRDAIGRLVEAGYPSGCPKEYLKIAADLSRAGIDLDDLTNKIREGIAKKVEPQRLNKVIARRGQALQEARVVVLGLEGDGIKFLDRQMTYRVMADYLLRGVSQEEIKTGLTEGDLSKFPALDNLIR
jgi:hypothetical protein